MATLMKGPEEPCLGVFQRESSMLGLLHLLVSARSRVFLRRGGLKAFEAASLTWGLGQAGLQSKGEGKTR